MHKLIIVLVVLSLMAATVVPVQAAAGTKERGGLIGFIAGCCFGIRCGAAYNEGKEIHFREWALVIPIVSFVIAIWNGIDSMNGITTKDLAAQYGAVYY